MFNPHGNKTSNGVVITLGMKVLDYNWEEGIVEGDRTSPYVCPAMDDPHTDKDLCDHDHWFKVNGSMFNGTRLKAI